MPAATGYTPNNNEIRDAIRQELAARRHEIDINKKYYDGNHAQPLKDAKDNVIVNVSRQVVDETVAFLVPKMPTIELDADTNTKTDDEQYLADRWEQAGGAVLVSNMATNGSLGGQVYVRVVPGEGNRHEIINLNPANIVTVWNADDYRDVLWHELHWTAQIPREDGQHGLDEAIMRQDVVRASAQSWAILTYKKDGSSWVQVEEVGWNYPLAPIISWQHLPRPNGFYGQHELSHRKLNDAINKVASDVKSILRYHAMPNTFGSGFEAAELQPTSVDGLWTVKDPNAKLYNVEMQSDLASSMAMLDKLEEMFFRQARVVVVKGGLDAYRGMTNLGIRAAFLPMITKTEQLHRHYSLGIEGIGRVLLMLDGRDFGVPMQTVWGSALPVDENEKLTLIERMMDRGLMSGATAAGRLGLDWEQEQRQILDEALETGYLFEGAPVGVSG
jgi:hypothetical protein